MLKRLKKCAAENNVRFGVKLTNTLGTLNTLGRLPGDEMYMSGRLLYPLSINTASRIAAEFDGNIDISFCGGIAAHNIEEVLNTGIVPVTAATDFLKPGGYLRMKQLAKTAVSIEQKDSIDLEKLNQLAQKSISDDNRYKDKLWRGYQTVSVQGKLPVYDCYTAPCKSACPIGQDIPEYISLTSEGRYKEAVELIYSKNPLPAITGHICAHQCQYNCTRRDYEGAVEIREMKKIALKNGFTGFISSHEQHDGGKIGRAAVIGAGPAGLSAAYFLAKEKFAVTVFDEHAKGGGVVRYNIPDFRIPREIIEHDVSFVEKHGVDFVYNYTWDFNVQKLKERGYDYILIAAGADKIRKFSVEGDNPNIMPSHTFISQFNTDKDSLNIGKRVVVVGAGDTAMDSARAALRVPGVEEAAIVYRRSERQMPCTEEEYELCRADGITFYWLRNPERFDSDGTLHLRVMELGGPDESGRRRPVATDKIETISCDTLIPSIGETVDLEEITSNGVRLDSSGTLHTDDDLKLEDGVYLIGDVRTGPSTIVNCIADARRAVNKILTDRNRFVEQGDFQYKKDTSALAGIQEQKGTIRNPVDRTTGYTDADFAAIEGKRCLQCNYLCNRCVDVCPNRANMALQVDNMKNAYQIIHLDAYCNECGNCAQFCPWEGKPYTDKITIFSTEEDFHNSKNDGMYIHDNVVLVRYDGTVEQNSADVYGNLNGEKDYDEAFRTIFAKLYTKHAYLFGRVDT